MTDYSKRWKTVDSLIGKKGLTQSALEEVNKIYALAKKEKENAQLIKALLYQASLQQSTDESGVKSFSVWQHEIDSSSQPARSILQSILAEQYLFYFQQHRWELYQRTATLNFTKNDPATWGVNDFHRKIAELYSASIADEQLLQQTKLASFEPIITKGNARYLRPTLFDLLTQRALDYYKTTERDVTQAATNFEINDSHFFLPAAEFARLVIVSKDIESLYYKALLSYQRILLFHLDDPDPSALADADIQRLQFIQQHAVMENRDSLYEHALNGIAEKYSQTAGAAQASYLVAQLHAGKAGAYEPLDNARDSASNGKNDYVLAAAICRKVLQSAPESEGKANAFNLLKQIEKKELNLSTEKVNLPEQPFRTLVGYRNFNTLYFRVAPLTEALSKKLENRYDDTYWNELVALQPLRSWNQALPATDDYQKHSAEVKIDALPTGQYLLLASPTPEFSLEKNPLAVQYFYVSRISYVNNNNEYFVLDRDNGRPLNGASVQSWWTQYDYNSRMNKKVKGEKQQADKNGYLQLVKSNSARQGSLQLEINYKNDHLFMDDREYVYFREQDQKTFQLNAEQFEKENSQVFFFTDRSIYRPGQTLYFKGIAITSDFTTHRNKTAAGLKSVVLLRNANGEDVDSLTVTSNEYGSYSGKFTLPAGQLNGVYSLVDEELGGTASFSVEEYKRPRFFVDYEKLKGTYKLNDSIHITGFAKAYAGNNIDGAQVRFRVQRVARFIYPWLYWKRGYPSVSAMEISNGVVETDKEGKFTIDFRAIPDLTINKEMEPVFDYKISADITDINGETRSGEITIPVSYKALQLKLSVPPVLSLDSLKSISLTTQNLQGGFEPAQVNVFIYGLQSPGRLIRKRYWQQPDQVSMSKEEFIKDFPNDEYTNEADPRSWAKDRVYLRAIDSTGNTGAFALPPSRLPEGWYAIEASTKDKYGEEVKDVQYVQLYDEKSKGVPGEAYTWSVQQHPSIEPGETSVITIGSSAKDVFLIQEIDHDKNPDNHTLATAAADTVSEYRFSMLNGKERFSFTPTEEERGGFGVYHFFVKNNRFYHTANMVSVPWTNKELQLSYEGFRDKTLPGSEEKWKLKISGYKKDRVAAEMLASMYDASLDQFKPHSWSAPGIWPSYSVNDKWMSNRCFAAVESQEKYVNEEWKQFAKTYDVLNTLRNVGIRIGMVNGSIRIRGVASAKPMAAAAPEQEMDKVAGASRAAKNDTLLYESRNMKKEEQPPAQDSLPTEKIAVGGQGNEAQIPVQIRKNFNETAFFLPDLKTDSAGNLSFSFTIPEALTKWKFQALTHTRELAFGYSSNTVITQKDLMVQPNAPRFLREGDKMELSAKVVNLTNKELTGTVVLDLINTASNQPVDGWFRNMYPTQYFTAAANQSTVVKFSIDVPYQYNSAVSYRFTAKAGENSDGEEAAMPVLTNSLLVTESMPLPMRGNGDKNFRFEKLLQSGNSETLQQHALTVEFTSNPAWYAVQALPYLMEYPYDCAEQTFNRYYANTIASKIANSAPRLKAIFERWKTADTAALVSNLQKNPELKAVLLEETPWVMQAKNETQQKKNIALLFDMMRMSKEAAAAFDKLKQMQSDNGGFVWFKGGPDDRFITQYILTGLGHLMKLDAFSPAAQKDWAALTTAAVKYLDQRIKDDYDNLVKHKADLRKNNLGYLQVQYLYMRSFFNYAIPGASFTAVNYYRKQSQQFWLQQNRYMQGMIALSLDRSGDIKTAADILKSLKQNAIINEETGMYWKDNIGGYYWHQAPVETQSLLIEAFAEISKDTKSVNDLKTWLLKQKQTQNWRTTKSTADACYALLLQDSGWINSTPVVSIRLGDKTISSEQQADAEAGTGYFKQTIDGPFVTPAMGDVSVKIAHNTAQGGSQPAWGAVYWQYFEQLDKITPAATPLRLSKKLFVEKNTDKGPVLEPVAENGYVKVGDKIKVRIELQADRDMEYVHMKDMRASGLEPVNVLSGYKWQGGLGYYETTRDASTNFFFGWLPKGTYVFEYPLFVSHAGNFSNGVTSIQCMYAPEFASHSEGIRINAE